MGSPIGNIVRYYRICQHQGGKALGRSGMVNICERCINAVIYKKPKVLTGFNQKVRNLDAN